MRHSLLKVLLARMNVKFYVNDPHTIDKIKQLGNCMLSKDEKARKRALMASCFIVMYVVDYFHEIIPGQEMKNIFVMFCKEKCHIAPETKILNNLQRSTKWEEDTLEDFFKISWRKKRHAWQRQLRLSGGKMEYALTEGPDRAENRQGNHRLFYIYRMESSKKVFIRRVSKEGGIFKIVEI